MRRLTRCSSRPHGTGSTRTGHPRDREGAQGRREAGQAGIDLTTGWPNWTCSDYLLCLGKPASGRLASRPPRIRCGKSWTVIPRYPCRQMRPFGRAEAESFAFTRLMDVDDVVDWLATNSVFITASPASRQAGLARC